MNILKKITKKRLNNKNSSGNRRNQNGRVIKSITFFTGCSGRRFDHVFYSKSNHPKTAEVGTRKNVRAAGQTMKQGKDMRSKNDIFHDYLKRLERIEASDQSYQWPPIRRWTSSSWQGFFRCLQEELHNGDRGYVANARGGFQGFWWSKKPENECYFQIEKLRLCIKIVKPDKQKQREAHIKASDYLLGKLFRTFPFFADQQ